MVENNDKERREELKTKTRDWVKNLCIRFFAAPLNILLGILEAFKDAIMTRNYRLLALYVVVGFVVVCNVLSFVFIANRFLMIFLEPMRDIGWLYRFLTIPIVYWPLVGSLGTAVWAIVQEIEVLPLQQKHDADRLQDSYEQSLKRPKAPTLPENATSETRALYKELTNFGSTTYQDAIRNSKLCYLIDFLASWYAYQPIAVGTIIGLITGVFGGGFPAVNWPDVLFRLFAVWFSVKGFEWATQLERHFTTIWEQEKRVNKKSGSKQQQGGLAL